MVQLIDRYNTALDSPDARFEMSIKDFLIERKSFNPALNLLIACSGGVDSMVLTHLLLHHCQQLNLKPPILLHVNYGLRGADSDEDANLVKDFAAKNGLKAFLLDVKRDRVEQKSGNLQAWAREVRYAWFKKHAQEHDVICLGHHQDDLAENVIMRIARGSGPDIGGMRVWQKPFWRPFLGVAKRDLRAFADRQKVPFREDLSNASLKYDRNLVRHKILPLLETMHPGAVHRIAALAGDLAEITEFLDERFQHTTNGQFLKWDELKTLPVGVALPVIASFLKSKLGPEQRLSRSLLLRAYQQLSSGQDWVEDLPGLGRLKVCSAKGLSTGLKKQAMHPRAAQYRAILTHPGDEVILEPGAKMQSIED